MMIVDTKRGSFGRVEILQMQDGTRVARKILDPKEEILAETDSDKLRRRFLREVSVQSSLSSDFFLPVLETGLEDTPPWFTMPYADSNFRQFIEHNRLGHDISVFVDPLCDILNALEALHELDFKHRDLKPENILLHDGKWKLSDLGLVAAGGNATSMLTSANSAWGSASYTSPEQLLDFSHVTCATDIYAFGCVLHDIFEGGTRIPYRRQTGTGLIGTVIERCTEESPDKRFRSVAGLRSSLIMALQGPTDSAPPSSGAEEWVQKLESVATWTPPDFANFTQFLRKSLTQNDRTAIFGALSEEALGGIQSQSEDAWNLVTDLYCDEASGQPHDFAYCDVVGVRLRKIFDLGTFSLKAKAALAAAHMANSHNRWFVMRIVMGMASPSVEDAFARRLAIEIKATGAETDFQRCAEAYGRSFTSCYHQVICETISHPSKIGDDIEF